MTLRAAIIGTGGIADAHLPAIRELEGEVELVTAVDLDGDRLRTFCDRNGIARGFTDPARMLEEERPDLVHVCTPPSTHAELSIACLRAGANVYCEKPPSVSLAELDRIEAVERETGRWCSFVFQWRFGSGAQHVRRLIEEEAFGRPLLALCNTTWFRDPEYYAVRWRGRWDTEAGGPTMGHGIHAMDLTLWLLGEWREVRALIGRLDREVETEDVSLALAEFANGAYASIVNSVVSPREETYLRFDFQRATVELRHLYGYTDGDWTFTPAPGEEELREIWEQFPPPKPSTHASQLRAIVSALARGDRPPTGPREVRPAMELITALYRSAMTDEPVRREELSPADPFYQVLHGNTPEWGR